jgi:hypothetical protein
MGPCFAAARRPGRGDPRRDVRVAPGAGRAVDQRGFHAHRDGELLLLSVTGPKMPADMTSPDMEKTVTAKADVVNWLKRSLEAVKTAHAA